MKKSKPNVGDTLYAVGQYYCRYLTGDMKVTKVGRKYFYCSEHKFYIDTWKHAEDSPINLYVNKQVYEDIIERSKLCQQIRCKVNNKCKLTLEELRELVNKL